jgi:hypothetical protein
MLRETWREPANVRRTRDVQNDASARELTSRYSMAVLAIDPALFAGLHASI